MIAQSKPEGRLIIAMGMGVADTPAEAAQGAVEQAQMQSTLNILDALDVTEMRVKASIGLQSPKAVRAQDITIGLSDAAEVVLVKGGQDVADAQSGKTTHVAVAAVEVFLPKQAGWMLKS